MLESDLHIYSVLASLRVKNLRVKRSPCPVGVLNKFLYSTLIVEMIFPFYFLLKIVRVSLLIASFINKIDF